MRNGAATGYRWRCAFAPELDISEAGSPLLTAAEKRVLIALSKRTLDYDRFPAPRGSTG
jgi:hypothetical protein